VKAIAPFVGRVFLWLAIGFALWYAAARPVSVAASWIGGKAVAVLAPAAVTGIAYRNGQVLLAVEPDYETARRGALPAGMILDVPVSPLLATFSLPFFLALMLATRPRAPVGAFAAGLAALLFFAGLGVGFDALKSLAGLAGRAGAPLFAFGQAKREVIALGYQLGVLIVPLVLPPTLWVAFNRDAVHALAGKRKPGTDHG
jgi:hypothetical protein